VQAATLLALQCLARDQVADVDHVAQLADVSRRLHALEQVLRLFVEQVETLPGAAQTQVAADDADVGRHDLAHLPRVLRDEHFLLVRHRSLVVPLRHALVEVVLVDDGQRVFGSRIRIDHRLDERVRRKTVAPVQSRAGTFTDGIQPADARLAVKIHLDAAAHVVGAGRDRNILLRDVDADAQALLENVGEVPLRFLGILMGDIQAYVVDAVDFHFVVDGACHDVARRQREALVILLHEFLAARQTQDAAIAAHGLGDEIGRMRLAGMVERRRVELDELHVLHFAFGPVDHGDAVAGRDVRIRRRLIHRPRSASGHQRHLREECVDFSRRQIEHVGAVAFDVGRASRDANAQMVLRDDFNRKVMFQHFDVGMLANGRHEAALNLRARVVGVVQDAEFAVSALAMQVERAVFLPVEVDAPLHEVANAVRCLGDYLVHGGWVVDVVACHHRVVDVLLEIVQRQVGHTGNSPLCLGRVGLFQRRLANDGNLSFPRFCHLKRVTHAGHTGTDDEKIKFAYHNVGLIKQ